MKILLLSTFGNFGGASVCALRLFEALKKHQVQVDLRVIRAPDDDIAKSIFPVNPLNKLRIFFLFAYERFRVLLNVSHRKYLYKFSIGFTGVDLVNNPHVIDADIVHLHWINFSFVSIQDIHKISLLKPVVWTFHDMWAFTGGCHYALNCKNYETSCDICFYLKGPSLSLSVQQFKIQHLRKNQFKALTTSRWLGSTAKESTVLKGWSVDVLPTPINIEVFKPLNKTGLRQKYDLNDHDFYVLFGAVDLRDERKGFELLLKAFRELKIRISNLHLLTFGKSNFANGDFNVTSFGSIASNAKLNEIYNLADVFVLPSLQDNLPNTVMESLSAGTPVVSFNSGGVIDMIDHKQNGYVCESWEPEELAIGIEYFVEESKRKEAGLLARKKIVSEFSEEVLVPKYLQLYENLLR